MDEGDPESVAAAARQLDPILRARKAAASVGPGDDEPAEPIETPLPELPDPTTTTATTDEPERAGA